MVKDREGYQVGVFKDGKLKKILKMKEGVNYIKEKERKERAKRPKRECTPAQLKALAAGRAMRDAMKSKKDPKLAEKVLKQKNVQFAKENKVKYTSKKKEKARVKREKELASGKHRGHESKYNDSDEDIQSSRNDDDSE